MEIRLPFNLATLLFLLSPSIFLLIMAWRKSKLQKEYKNLPPSPPKLPIIGHLHLLIRGLPHQALARLAHKYGRVLHLQLGEVLTVVISTREAAKEVLKDQDPSCASRPESLGCKIMWYNYADLVFRPYDDYWRQMRKICVMELLSAKNVISFGYIRDDEVSRLIGTIHSSSGGSINITNILLQMSSSIICRAALGKAVIKDRDALIVMMREGLTMAGGFELADLFPSSKLLNFLCLNKYKLLWMHRRLDLILDDIVEQHKLKQGGEFGGEDIVDALLRIKKNKELHFTITMDNIKGIIFDMFTGGTETTSSNIDWAMAELMRNPRVMAKAQAEIRQALKGKKTVEDTDIQALKYLKLLIKETLRLHPPAPLLPRACRDECTVNGYSVPLKSKVLVNVWSLGREPEYWHQPEAFQPERFEDCSIDFLGNNFEFLPFGTGKRMCPGMNFGLTTVELLLARLLYHFDWKLPNAMGPDDIDMSERGGLTLSTKSDLYLVPTVYNAP